MRIRQWDGVRAVAILLVFSEHAFGLNQGWARPWTVCPSCFPVF